MKAAISPFNPYCRSCQASHPPGQHKGGKPSPAKDVSAAAPARAKSGTKAKGARPSTPRKPATATRTAANGAAAGTSAAGRGESLDLGGRPSTQGQIKTLVREVRRGVHSKVDPLEALKTMSRIELEAIAALHIMERVKKQKAKAKTQARWRKKVRAAQHAD